MQPPTPGFELAPYWLQGEAAIDCAMSLPGETCRLTDTKTYITSYINHRFFPQSFRVNLPIYVI